MQAGESEGSEPERVNYHFGLVLDVDDFATDQSYHREKQRQHNRRLHGHGVVEGLEVLRSGPTIHLSPGTGVTTAGDLIEVPDPVEIEIPAGVAVIIAIRYGEIPIGENRIREIVEVAAIEKLEPCWLPLATVAWGDDGQVTIDASIRRPLALD